MLATLVLSLLVFTAANSTGGSFQGATVEKTRASHAQAGTMSSSAKRESSQRSPQLAMDQPAATPSTDVAKTAIPTHTLRR